ncbi:MAG TPA: right-handed parallel beta-helix repeat-containing protein, partial [Ktedonobacteraceae bacterium]
MQETLEAFIRARLLTTNQISGKTTIEVSHEALIREWKRLAEWLREARDDILFQQSLSEDSAEWEQRKRPRDRLYRGVQLKEAQAWARRNRPSEQEVAFLRASTARRILSLVSIIVVVLLLVSSMGIAGWYVFLQPKPTLVTTLQDNVVGSLRWCIDNAPSGSTIRFAQGMRGIIELTGGDLVFPGGKQFTIAGPRANQLTISGGNIDAHIHVSKGATLNISDLSFKNSETVIYAFLFNQGSLTVTNSIISGNKTTAGVTSFGGGIENRGTLTVINSTFSNNSSFGDLEGEGGGIFNEGKLTVTHSTFSNNSAISSKKDGLGGGINNTSTGTITVTDSIFSENKAIGKQGGAGGGIDNSGKLTVIHSTFSNNSASSSDVTGFGGGIYNYRTGTLMVTDNTFSGNSASGKQDGQGGGIDNEGKLTVTHSIFSDNKAIGSGDNGFGGGIYNFRTGTLMVTNSTFSGNSASGKQDSQGGGINNFGELTVTTSTFSHNSASSSSSFGGGILSLGKGSSAIIRFCTIYGNTSSTGGGIWIDPTGSSHMTMSSSVIAAN